MVVLLKITLFSTLFSAELFIRRLLVFTMWNKVLLGFDGEEETVNFGCRQMAVYESAVYETNTLAVISKNNDVCFNLEFVQIILRNL